MALVLYRKYRPASFKDVVGQEHVVRTLTSAIAANDFAHSYLFTGPRGTGKTTLARLIAKSLNCQNRKNGEYEPCNKCVSCDEIARGVAIDLIEIDAASNRGIDEIRALKEGIRFGPTHSKYKVFIVDEVHMLTKEAFNALLKTLEEPPAHAVFVLATTEIQKVLPTIVSRSQRFDFRRLRHGEIKKRLEALAKREEKSVEPRILDVISTKADGSIRDAESMLGQIFALGNEATMEDIEFLLGAVDLGTLHALFEHLAAGKKPEIFTLMNAIKEQGADLEEFLRHLLRYVRWMMNSRIADRNGDGRADGA
ncbi:MAG: DNA polymerase III subunit gamma/tau [Candidatus Spechtbacteria bacterium]|nr:DNA polymerase III subunit gamma/tau [Candidatus Spechtbacteria bacterium]